MNARELAESIARDSTCAKGEFHERVKSIIPYLIELDEAHAEIARLTAERDAAREQLDNRNEFIALRGLWRELGQYLSEPHLWG